MSKYLDFDIIVNKLVDRYNDLAGIYGNDKDYVKGYYSAIEDIMDVPAADVEEVRHGKWIYKGHSETRGHVFECSVCGRWMFANSIKNIIGAYPYCHCGAKMESVDGLEED